MIIRLTEDKLHEVIKECVMELYLRESNQHVLYHNTSVFTLTKMIEENKMFFSPTGDRPAQMNIRGGKSHYMSLTRYKGDYEGYQAYNMNSVRITIDNDKFQSIMRNGTEPMEAYSPNRWGFGGKSAKANHQAISKLSGEFKGDYDDEDAKEEHFGDYYEDEHVMFPEEFVQAEESMNTNKDSIDNPLRFITRIDVRYTDQNDYIDLIKTLNSHPEWKRITYFHKNGLKVTE